VGVVKSVRDAQPFKEVMAEPSGLQRGLQDVLILIEGVHQPIPEAPPAVQPMYIAPPPPGDAKAPEVAPANPGGGTEADRLRLQYKSLGEAQNHTYGQNPAGSKPVDFTHLGTVPTQTPANPPAAQPGGAATPAARPPTPQPGAVQPRQGSVPAQTPVNPPAAQPGGAAAPAARPPAPQPSTSKPPATAPGAPPSGPASPTVKPPANQPGTVQPPVIRPPGAENPKPGGGAPGGQIR
jgi:hypothetical protein